MACPRESPIVVDRRHDRAPRRGRAGFTLLEISVILGILAVGLALFSQTFTSISRLEPRTSEGALAVSAVRNECERIRASPFDELFERFNADAADDPGGPGTAPGDAFTVGDGNFSLTHPDGAAGRIVLPIVGGELREDFVDAALGMPRDLNGDGAIDGADHRGDYVVLPVLVEVRWMQDKQERSYRGYLTLTAGLNP